MFKMLSYVENGQSDLHHEPEHEDFTEHWRTARVSWNTSFGLFSHKWNGAANLPQYWGCI